MMDGRESLAHRNFDSACGFVIRWTQKTNNFGIFRTHKWKRAPALAELSKFRLAYCLTPTLGIISKEYADDHTLSVFHGSNSNQITPTS
jgi:hypothetical protein